MRNRALEGGKEQHTHTLVRFYCGHVIQFKSVYAPAINALVWCYRCAQYVAVHDHPAKIHAPKVLTSQPTRVG